ncbi:hypothetical protein [Paenibacillus lemnae]|uniref:Uncharacterized protein n=1 Tax=Paenibacillus lemnae TaxID=1330551 RepID=A0A848M6F6_PAELE|nr:hypothetical protein [Paenibacillus lemnae]NMO96567.1 hypothetical protein [Paenibacillus lemnae]
MNHIKTTLISLLILTMVLITSGCSEQESSDFVEGLKPTQGQFSIHLFYGDIGNHQLDMHELNAYVNSDEKITNLIPQAQAREATGDLKKKLKTIGINTFPAYAVVDTDGVQLITPYLSEVKDFINIQAAAH